MSHARNGVRLVVLVGVLVAAAGCFRTRYHNFEPPSSYALAPAAIPPPREDSGWQHFFIFGWAPSEKVIDATARCGSVQQVQEIRTEQTFLQGFITAIAGYYVNIYSPYTGEVVCQGDRRE